MVSVSGKFLDAVIEVKHSPGHSKLTMAKFIVSTISELIVISQSQLSSQVSPRDFFPHRQNYAELSKDIVYHILLLTHS